MSYYIPKSELEIRKHVDIANDCFFSNYADLEKVCEKKDKEEFIDKVILSGNYPKVLNDFVRILYKNVEKDNLYNLATNLRTVKLERINPFVWLVADHSYGTYDSLKNVITYFNKNSIPHELLHLSSTASNSYSGFNVIKGGINFANGFNEGYTEMLAQKIFFNSVFTNSAYKTNVYLLRLFELLYDDPKELETAYFNADFENPIKNFLKYGSIEEFKFLIKHLDYFAETSIWNDEENIIFELLIDKIEKTEEKQKVKKANDIYNEYIIAERGMVK